MYKCVNSEMYSCLKCRFGNVATLSVLPITRAQSSDPHIVTGASPAGFSKMDLDFSSFFYIGGTPKGYRVS